MVVKLSLFSFISVWQQTILGAEEEEWLNQQMILEILRQFYSSKSL